MSSHHLANMACVGNCYCKGTLVEHEWSKRREIQSFHPPPPKDRCNFDGIGTFDDDFRIVKRKLFTLKKKSSGSKGKIREPVVLLLRGHDSRGIQFVELIEVWSSLVLNWMPNYGLQPVDRTFIETLMFFRSIGWHQSFVRTNATLVCVSRNSI